jgi:hypothetical protein
MLIRMTRHVGRAAVVAVALSLTACQMADGPLPPETGDRPNEIEEISRDMFNAANQDPAAADDLVKDVTHYAEGNPAGLAAAVDLSRRLAEVLAGKTFMATEAVPLARSCWIAVAGSQLSDRQVENLRSEFTSQLTMLGVDQSQAQSLATQVGVVQRAVNTRKRRWYELR